MSAARLRSNGERVFGGFDTTSRFFSLQRQFHRDAVVVRKAKIARPGLEHFRCFRPLPVQTSIASRAAPHQVNGSNLENSSLFSGVIGRQNTLTGVSVYYQRLSTCARSRPLLTNNKHGSNIFNRHNEKMELPRGPQRPCRGPGAGCVLLHRNHLQQLARARLQVHPRVNVIKPPRIRGEPLH